MSGIKAAIHAAGSQKQIPAYPKPVPMSLIKNPLAASSKIPPVMASTPEPIPCNAFLKRKRDARNG